MNGTPAAIEDCARLTAASMSQGIEITALTPPDTKLSTCDAWRWASLSAFANFILTPAAATASSIAFFCASRNGSILSKEIPITMSLASAMPDPRPITRAAPARANLNSLDDIFILPNGRRARAAVGLVDVIEQTNAVWLACSFLRLAGYR